MSTSTISKDRVLAAVVRTFFKYFATGVVNSTSGNDTPESLEPSQVKALMLEHYESISRYFNREVFFAIFQMNYSEAEMEPMLRSFMTKTTTDMDLVRLACRDEAFYKAMVNEYRRHLELLLCGRLETSDEHETAYTRWASSGSIDPALADRLIAETASNAYAMGGEAARTLSERK